MGIKELENILLKMKKVAIAFSGGVDSSALLALSIDLLGKENVLPIQARMATSTPDDIDDTKHIASLLNITPQIVYVDTLANPDFIKNPQNRCFICKMQMFSALIEHAQKIGFYTIIDGSNIDDLSDFRPGLAALKKLGVKSPFIEAKVGKEEIRTIAKRFNLPVWNRSASACLASRIPYGEEITQQKLEKIAKAEQFLKTNFKLETVRVRSINNYAIIETNIDKIETLVKQKNRDKIIDEFSKLGFTRTTIDIAGYKRGMMNEMKK